MSKKWSQPEGERMGRAATQRPIHDDRDDLTPLPQGIPGDVAYRKAERLDAKVSDVRQLIGAEIADVKSKVSRLDKEQGATRLAVDQLIEARKEDRVHIRWLIGLGVIISMAVMTQSFVSCVQARESIAELKAEVRSILKGQ